jgi:ABC-type glutathione transport system ATPase component
MPDAALTIENIRKRFPAPRRGNPPAVVLDGISLELHRGETLGIMGGSGAGKTTLGLIAAGLEPPTSGRVAFHGESTEDMSRTGRRRFRRRVQMVFQNPEASLNPGKTVGQALTEVLRLIGVDKSARAAGAVESLAAVGLADEFLCRLPCQLSGGQNQRVALARALLVDPEILILDEPAAALDISERARLLHLLRELQEKRGLGMLFISHDPAAVRFIAHRTTRLESGRIHA